MFTVKITFEHSQQKYVHHEKVHSDLFPAAGDEVIYIELVVSTIPHACRVLMKSVSQYTKYTYQDLRAAIQRHIQRKERSRPLQSTNTEKHRYHRFYCQLIQSPWTLSIS